MRSTALLLALLLPTVCDAAQDASGSIDQTMLQTSGVAVQAGHDANVSVVNNYQKSEDYQELLKRRERMQKHAIEHPEDASFRTELEELDRDIDAFKRDVMKLAESFIPSNTVRLNEATHLINEYEYAKARTILDPVAITHDQIALLKRQQEPLTTPERIQIARQLDDDANELSLLAQLTAINYALGGQRIPKTIQYFEQAMQSGRTPERLFAYATFLQNNNKHQEAERYHTEALKNYRALSIDNSKNYLNHLGEGDPYSKEQERIYTAGVNFSREKVKAAHPETVSEVALISLANRLNKLGTLVETDAQRQTEAEQFYTEELKTWRILAKADSYYLMYVARTLNNLGDLAAADKERRAEAERYYTEALTIISPWPLETVISQHEINVNFTEKPKTINDVMEELSEFDKKIEELKKLDKPLRDSIMQKELDGLKSEAEVHRPKEFKFRLR